VLADYVLCMTRIDQTELLAQLAENALSLSAETPWDKVTLSALCAAGEVTLVDCAKVRVTKAHVTAYLDSIIDQAMLKTTNKVDASQSVRDRLFDVLMGRFDTMEDQRGAWVSILKAEKSDMVASLARRARRAVTSAWALEAAGVSAGDLRGAGRAVGLARVLRLVESVWLEDGPELAKTMARLDQELRTAEEWVGRVEAVRGFFAARPASEPTPAARQD
jgi:hypothetical protein